MNETSSLQLIKFFLLDNPLLIFDNIYLTKRLERGRLHDSLPSSEQLLFALELQTQTNQASFSFGHGFLLHLAVPDHAAINEIRGMWEQPFKERTIIAVRKLLDTLFEMRLTNFRYPHKREAVKAELLAEYEQLVKDSKNLDIGDLIAFQKFARKFKMHHDHCENETKYEQEIENISKR